MGKPKYTRVLFFGEATSLSHVVRPSVLAEALPPDRFQAALACDPRFDFLLPNLGVERIEIASLPVETALDNVHQGRPIIDADTLDKYVRDDLRVIREFSPDLIVGDLRQSLAVSSRLEGIPYVNIANAQWSPYSDLEFELAEHPLIDVVGDGVAQMLFKFFFPVGSFFHTLPLNAVRNKYGLPWMGIDFKEHFLYGDYAVYPDVPEIVPTRTLPSTHIYLGPILWYPEIAKPEWWDSITDEKPIVYVNLGSSGQQRLFEVIIRALADLPIQVIAATAGRGKITAAPENVFLADFLPGIEAAERSALVICNGGTMSGQQSLAAGTPMLGVVSNMDQMVFSKAVSRIGAGETIRERYVTVESIRDLARKMLSQESYRRSAEWVAQVYKRYDASARFVEFMDKIVTERRVG